MNWDRQPLEIYKKSITLWIFPNQNRIDNHLIVGSKRILLALSLFFSSVNLFSQDQVYWSEFAATNDWDYGGNCNSSSVGGNWHYITSGGGDRQRPDCFSSPNIIRFDNGAHPIMNLNSNFDYSVNRIEFITGTGDREINTNASRSLYFKQNNGNAKIENYVASTTHTFNVNVNIDVNTWMEINPVNGYLVFNNPIVNNSGNTINLYGYEQVEFIGDISSSVGSPGVIINNGVTAVYRGVSKTYNGTTEIKSGATLRISSNQSLGNVILEIGGYLIVDANSTLTINGTWTGGGTIKNNGTIVLVGPAAFPGVSTTIGAMNNLTINRPTGVSLDNSLVVNGTLTLQSGTLDIGSYIFTMGTTSPAIQGGPFSSSCMIIADDAGCQVRKSVNTAIEPITYFFPIGDNLGTSEYSPILIEGSSVTANGYVGVSVSNLKHPENNSINDYLKRYWTVNQSGVTGGTISVTATYVPADIIGSEDKMVTARYEVLPPWIKHDDATASTLKATYDFTISNSDISGLTKPVVSINPSGSVIVCLNNPLTLTATAQGTPEIGFSWNPTGENTPSINPPTDDPEVVQYIVTITDGNGLTADARTTVTVFGGDVQINGFNPVCQGATYRYWTDSDPEVTYIWEAFGGTIIGSSSDFEVHVKWTSPPAGLIRLTKTFGQCSGVGEINVTIKPAPIPSPIYHD